MKSTDRRKARQVWHPPEYEIKDIRAIQSIAEGTASETEQKRGLDWIIKAAGTYDEPFRPGEQDTVFYALGRRSVGLAIVKLLSLKPELFRAEGDVDV